MPFVRRCGKLLQLNTMGDQKISAVIIDDEKHAVATLAWKIERFCPGIEVVEQFTDPIAALEYLRRDQPQLLFLDIEMPRLNGFEILEELGEDLKMDVIFTTAYDEFGIRAIKVSALDYLLKPIQVQELKQAVEKFKMRNLSKSTREEQFKVLFSNIKEPAPATTGKIALATKEDIEFVAPENILYCSSESNYTFVFLADGRKKLISRTLKDFEELLKSHNFFRIHHSHLVNLKHIKKFVRSGGGYLLMSNDTKLSVSRSRKDDLLQLF